MSLKLDVFFNRKKMVWTIKKHFYCKTARCDIFFTILLSCIQYFTVSKRKKNSSPGHASAKACTKFYIAFSNIWELYTASIILPSHIVWKCYPILTYPILSYILSYPILSYRLKCSLFCSTFLFINTVC